MSTATKTASPALTTWTIDAAHSHVEFAVRHMMISTVKGRFGGVTGTVRTDESNPANAQVEVEIDAATIDTREAKRDMDPPEENEPAADLPFVRCAKGERRPSETGQTPLSNFRCPGRTGR